MKSANTLMSGYGGDEEVMNSPNGYGWSSTL